jgi:heme/copper-type cytochrome/quinol oxidase subunit 1
MPGIGAQYFTWLWIEAGGDISLESITLVAGFFLIVATLSSITGICNKKPQ